MKSLFTLFVLVLAGTAVAPASLAAESDAKPSVTDAVSSQYPNSGKVLDMINTDLYTYVEVSESGGGSRWLAASKVKVAKGDTIRYGDGAVMTNFHSKTLNKTFPTITFLDKVIPVK